MRIKLIERPFMKRISVLEPKIYKWWNKKEKKLCMKFNIN